MEKGLQLTPRTREDLRIINDMLQESDFYTEYNSEFGYFFFPEEEDNYDSLEEQINELFEGVDVRYRIEGIF